MSVFDEVSKHAAYISLKLGKLKRNTPEYDATQSTKEAILALGKELSVTNGTNSLVADKKEYKSRPIPTCKAYRNSNFSVNNGVATFIEFDKNEYDDLEAHNDKRANFHSETVNNDSFYIHEEGKYFYAACVRLSFAADPAEIYYELRITSSKPGTIKDIFVQSFYADATTLGLNAFTLTCAGQSYLFPGDRVRVSAFHNNSAALNATIIPNADPLTGGAFFTISGRM